MIRSSLFYALFCVIIGASAEATEVFTSAWFVGLLVALIMVSTFFALLCLIQQNRGGIYTAQFAGQSSSLSQPLRIKYESIRSFAFVKGSSRSPVVSSRPLFAAGACMLQGFCMRRDMGSNCIRVIDDTRNQGHFTLCFSSF